MSIKEILEKVKPFYTLILILLVSSIAFALGRLSAFEERHVPIKIMSGGLSQAAASVISQNSIKTQTNMGQGNDESSQNGVEIEPLAPSGEVIGSKTGKKYYYPWCGTIKRVKPENQVHFASIAEAKAAGYVAGGNCKGLK